jgi:hypothetical protein
MEISSNLSCEHYQPGLFMLNVLCLFLKCLANVSQELKIDPFPPPNKTINSEQANFNLASVFLKKTCSQEAP